MTETLHWYAETSGGVQTGNCTVTENGGALHLTADLPAGTLKAVRAEMPWTMEADERLFMNGYQTWTYSPELDRNGKLRGTDHIPGFLLKKYAFDRYGDYHFVPYGHQKGQSQRLHRYAPPWRGSPGLLGCGSRPGSWTSRGYPSWYR